MFLKAYMSELQHQWSSIESKVVSYNELWKDTTAVKFFEDFLASNPRVFGHFNSKQKGESELIDDQDKEEVDENPGQDTEETPVRNTVHELGRKDLGTSFYHHQVYEEMIERNDVERVTFGPKEDETNPGQKLTFKESLEDYMTYINNKRKDELYSHGPEDCSQICQDRGCGRVATIDGESDLRPSITISCKLLLLLFTLRPTFPDMC